jgi:hypothetical protein
VLEGVAWSQVDDGTAPVGLVIEGAEIFCRWAQRNQGDDPGALAQRQRWGILIWRFSRAALEDTPTLDL